MTRTARTTDDTTTTGGSVHGDATCANVSASDVDAVRADLTRLGHGCLDQWSTYTPAQKLGEGVYVACMHLGAEELDHVVRLLTALREERSVRTMMSAVTIRRVADAFRRCPQYPTPGHVKALADKIVEVLDGLDLEDEGKRVRAMKIVARCGETADITSLREVGDWLDAGGRGTLEQRGRKFVHRF